MEDRFALDGEGPIASDPGSVVMDEEGQLAVDLGAMFDDPETPDEELTFEIIGEYDTTLLEAAIDGDQLNLTGLLNAFGTTYVSIRATDGDGNWVETYLGVEVLNVNDPPVLEMTAELVDGLWVLYGTVTDVDNEESFGLVLEGDLAEYFPEVEVQSDGTFYVTQSEPGEIIGWVSGKATDGDGLESNTVHLEVG